MTIGEKIYKLRTERNLSQGDLSEILEVSRQSVSKWENGAATPDLDKIIKLSEVFGITIDELVKNEEISLHVSEEPEKPMVIVKKESGFPPRKIVGTVLLSLSAVINSSRNVTYNMENFSYNFLNDMHNLSSCCL